MVRDAMVDGIVDEILAPEFSPTEWSLAHAWRSRSTATLRFADAVECASRRQLVTVSFSANVALIFDIRAFMLARHSAYRRY